MMRAMLLLVMLAGTAQAQEMTPEQAAAMAAFEAGMTPGAPHAWLAEQVGDFSATVKSYHDPSAEPEVNTARIVRHMELGGRVLHEAWTGNFMDMPFSGIGRTGYDNVTGRYWTTWTDNLSTGVFVAYGERKADGTLVFEGDMPDPMTGQMTRTRSVATHEDGVEHMKMYAIRDGQETLTMAFEIRRD